MARNSWRRSDTKHDSCRRRPITWRKSCLTLSRCPHVPIGATRSRKLRCLSRNAARQVFAQQAFTKHLLSAWQSAIPCEDRAQGVGCIEGWLGRGLRKRKNADGEAVGLPYSARRPSPVARRPSPTALY